MRKSRLSEAKQRKLREHFVAGTTARTAARLVGVNKSTASSPILATASWRLVLTDGSLSAPHCCHSSRQATRLFFIFRLAVIAGIFWLAMRRESLLPEPIYDGKALSVWLSTESIDRAMVNRIELTDEAVQAVRAIGTNSIPYLLATLQCSGTNVDAIMKRHRAATGFRTLGSEAAPAYPKLMSLALTSPNSFVRDAAVNALMKADSAGVALFVQALQSRDQRHRLDRPSVASGRKSASSWILNLPVSCAAGSPQEVCSPHGSGRGAGHRVPAGMLVGPEPARLPGLLAHILIGKYCYHLPLYRQKQIYAQRRQVHLPRQTLARWVELAADYRSPNRRPKPSQENFDHFNAFSKNSCCAGVGGTGLPPGTRTRLY